jgi:S-DNA-T family DNA segregation ATPase FtsK/SpoIIIE
MHAAVRLLWSLALLLVALFLLIAIVDYAATQMGSAVPATANVMGFLGALTAHGLVLAWGLGALVVPVVVFGWSQALWRRRDLSNIGRRITGALLLLPAIAGLIHLIPVGTTNWLLLRWGQTELHGLGGAVGRLLAGGGDSGGLLIPALGIPGTITVLVLVVAGALWLMDLGLGRYVRRLGSAMRAWREQPVEADPETERLAQEPFIPPSDASGKRPITSVHEVAEKLASASVPTDAQDLVNRIRAHREALERRELPATGQLAPVEGQQPTTTAAPPAQVVSAPAQPSSQPAPAAPTPPEPAESTEPTPALQPAKPKPPAKPAAGPAGDYQLPSFQLLDNAPPRKDAEHQAETDKTGKAIEETFSHFDIGVQVVGATRGPVVTQYEIRLLDQGMRVNKVEGFEKDLQMKLGTEGIRIVAPLPNKTTIGVEVPNKVKSAVTMRELVDAVDMQKMVLPVILGRDAVGRALVSDLAKMPHLLVAGATGMGKSVCMNAMISSILLFRTPDEVKFIMVDPKMVELAGYEDIPHLITPPITDMTKAHAALEWACQVMDRRYEILKTSGVRDIGTYNALGKDELTSRLARKDKTFATMEDDFAEAYIKDRPEFMPYIVVLVDEYADLMMVNKEVEKSIVRLAAKSRACGIHVILTTQRPSADVVTGLIKSNLPCRICFRVVDKNNSRVVLDVSGAENLLGKGDMLFLQPGTSIPIRAQGVWLKDSEIAAIVEHAKAQARPDYEADVVKVGAVAQTGGGSGGGGSGGGDAAAGGAWLTDRDFHGAVQSMYRYNRTGADFFRRKMNVGYNKATSFVEQLEDLGFVGPQKGTAPREILKTWDDWIALLKEQGHAWEEGDDLYINPTELNS